MDNKNNDLKVLLGLIRRMWIVLKEDTLEIYEKFLEFRKQRAQPKKRLNFWVGTLIVVAGLLSFWIVFPLFAGMVSIIFEDTTSANVASPSSEAIIGFILMSAALGALMMLFIRTRSENAESASNRMLKFAGKCFLFTALSLAFFVLISPILPTIKESTDLYEMTIKIVAMLSFLDGCITFIMADVIGLLYIFKL